MKIDYNEEQHKELVSVIRNIEDDEKKERIIIVGLLIIVFAIAYKYGFYIEYIALMLIIALFILFKAVIVEVNILKIESKKYIVKREKATKIEKIIKDGKRIWKINFESFEIEREVEEKISEEDKEFDIIYYFDKNKKDNKKNNEKNKNKILAVVKSIY